MSKIVSLLLFALPACAQWNTSGGDAQRSSWIRSDPKISRTSLQTPGFSVVWKVKLDNQARQQNSLGAVAVQERYIGYRGFRALGFVGGSSDNVFVMDTDLGRIEWQKHLTSDPAPAGTADCPGGVTAMVARPSGTAFPAAPGRGGGGRANYAKSGVGEPDEGSVIIAQQAARAAAAAAATAAGAGRRGPGRGAFGPPPRRRDEIHVVTGDGKLHLLWISNGNEPDPPLPFVPAGANVRGLTVVNRIAYAATTQGCGGAPNGIWALDLESKEVVSWKAGSGDVAGSEGFAFGPDGTLYVATTTGDLVALDPKTLEPKTTYSAGKSGFVTTPVIFSHKGKTLIAAGARDGRMHLLDAADLASPVAVSAPSSDAPVAALATWQDPSGTPWLLAPTTGAVAAWKLVDHEGGLSWERAWTSRDMVSAMTPMIVNGVVFALSGGAPSKPAVLYALDGMTGKELWSSGNTITSYAHSGGLSGGASQIYLETYDGTLWAFGFPIEH
ncbi:MAG TPA: hypothetical protein VG456_28625 [Candidatus Sulfopaludibacter sp.]|jgi:outer membrane protein assembly factor BamB|nr:hypothetical protein [Candidatus Sulfopaludibacter sp.]